ncbi:MAG: hypothetical protein MN733_02585 [Nitrososphaera sp.]|nr:hypothetical protein [Nitrososphaera sp.]
MFQGQVELKEGKSFLFEPGIFYSHSSNRYLSSLDDRKHVAVLYRFGKSSASSFGVAPIVVVYRETQVSIKADELLLLVDKVPPYIVKDIAYRKESLER